MSTPYRPERPDFPSSSQPGETAPEEARAPRHGDPGQQAWAAPTQSAPTHSEQTQNPTDAVWAAPRPGADVAPPFPHPDVASSPLPNQAPGPQGGAPAATLAPGLLSSPPENDAAAGFDLTKVFGSGDTRVVALDRINVRFARGTFTAIMGPSGSGKSTLMHCLAGLDRITEGRVFLAGQEMSAMSDAKLTSLRRDNVGFVFQSFNLLPMLTAEQNILLPLDLAGRKPDRELYEQLINGLGIADRLKHRPAELSGGQQQRVACARAMITKPHVVFADEPTGALDSRSGANLLSYLRHCVDDLGQTIIMVTHDAKAASYADRALMLLDGHIVDDIDSPDAESVGAAMARLEA